MSSESKNYGQNNKTFEYVKEKNNSIIRIIVDGELSSNRWGRYWPLVSKEIQNIHNGGIIELDLSDCFWGDPFPIMSILLEFIAYKDCSDIIIRVILPVLQINDCAAMKKIRFYRFLEEHGFLQIMENYGFELKMSESFSKENIINIKSGNENKRLYQGLVIIPARVIELNEEADVAAYVDSVELEFCNRFKSITSIQAYDAIRMRMHHILHELIDNVYKHAYEKNQVKRFAVYIRSRAGAKKKQTNHTTANEVEVFINKESKRNPALDQQIIYNSDMVLEIFFVDSGMGIIGSMKSMMKSGSLKASKYPVRDLCSIILKDGEKNKHSDRQTPFGGLHFLCNILKEDNAYIWCNEGKEWVCGECRKILVTGIGQNTKESVSIENDKGWENSGLCWCFRIPFADKEKFDSIVAKTWAGKKNEHPVFKLYSEKKDSLNIRYLFCIDEREHNCILMSGNPEDWEYFNLEDKDYYQSKEYGIWTYKRHKMTESYDTIVWFPIERNTKDEVNRKLSDYYKRLMRFVSKKNKLNLIIADIKSQELMTYYYALVGPLWRRKALTNFERIILITNKWEAIVITISVSESSRIVTDSDELSKKYFQTPPYKERKIWNSIYSYSDFLRRYESAIFWKKVKEHFDERVFINSEIQWEDNLRIFGFLDFEQIYLIPELNEILKRTLFRVKAFNETENVEFVSLENTAKRICNDLNISNQSSDTEPLSYTWVSMACATGYTRESYYNTRKIDVNTVLFAHNTYNPKDSNTLYLMIWPKKEYFKDFPKDKTSLYYRLGRTSLVSIVQSEQLIDTEKIYETSVCNKEEAYAEFQNRYVNFVKYGHYRTDNHHYLIGFDLVTYIQACCINKNGCVKYLLWRVLKYLGGEKYNEVVQEILDRDWRSILKEYNAPVRMKTSPEEMSGDYVIYHANTVTEYLMKYIKSVLPRSVSKMVFPINIVDISQKGMPVIISPIAMQRLRELLKEKRVLYIDSSFSTGRRIAEVENILRPAQCQEISYFTLLDMRRLQNEGRKITSYWRLSIPRLDDESDCIFCNMMKVIESFMPEVDSSLRKRLEMWRTNWQEINITNTLSDHGITCEDLQDYSLIDAPNVADTNILNIYMAEKLCESYRNDYILEFISKNACLSHYQKMQLVCTQICLFGNVSSKQLQMRLLSELLVNIVECQEVVNEYTSLAGIVLLYQSDRVLYELFRNLLDKPGHSNRFMTDEQVSKLMNCMNPDLLLVFCYYVRKYPMFDHVMRKYNNHGKKSKLIEEIDRQLLPERTIKLIYQDYIGLVVNEQGPRHNVRMIKLITDPCNTFEEYKEKCEGVLADVDRLYELSTHMTFADASGFQISDREHIRNSLETEKNNLYREIQNQLTSLRKCNSGEYKSGESLINALHRCQKTYESFSESYFISNHEKYKNYLRKKIETKAEEYGKSIKISFDEEDLITTDSMTGQTNIKHKRYYWNRWIEQEFVYLLINVEHIKKKLTDEYDMEIKIKYTGREMTIMLISWSVVDKEGVHEKFLEANRIEKERSRAFEVYFDFSSLDNIFDERTKVTYYKLLSILNIPACYPSHRRKENGKNI